MSARPPRLARALLEIALPPHDVGAITGDLDEEYVRFAVADRGRLRADLWYWRQVLRSVPGILLRRIARRGPLSGTGDLSYALRMLRRRPATTLTAVATLVLGLGLNITVFAVLYSVLLAPLPYGHAERVVRPIPEQLFFLNADEAVELERRMTSFDAFAAWGRTLFLFEDDDGAEEVRGARVGWRHFEMLGVDAALGRTFTREDAVRDDALILSHGLWTRRFGQDPAVVGSSVDMFGRPMTIIGVLASNHVPIEYDWQAWRPIPLDPAALAGSGLSANGRLRPGVTLEEARGELRTVLPSIWAAGGAVTTEGERAALEMIPIRSWLLGDVSQLLLLLELAVAVVLLLACVNVANLLLVQAGSRAGEFRIRTALGGSRGRLVRQRLIEVGTMVLIAGAISIPLARLAVDVLAGRLPPDLPRASSMAFSGEVLAFAVAATLVVAAITGVVPALIRAPGGGRASGSAVTSRALRWRSGLVGAEAALAVVLVVSAGLMIKSLTSLLGTDPGFSTESVYTFRPSPPTSRYADDAELLRYYAELREAIERTPGVASTGAIQFLPMTPGGWWTNYRADGATVAGDGTDPLTAVRVVEGDYFATLDIPVLGGRALRDSDGEQEAAPAMVVNQAFAGEAFAGVDPVGRTIDMDGTTVEIVGVVGDVRQSGLGSPTHPEVYLPFGRVPWRRMHWVVRSAPNGGLDPTTLAGAIRGVDPGVALVGPRPIEEVVHSSLGATPLITQLLVTFGLVGLGLGSVGVYGVTAHAVARRRREIGIRLALGADSGRLRRRVFLTALLPVGIGLAAGLVVSAGIGRSVSGVLHGVEALDPVVFLGAPMVLLLVAAVAVGVPAVRAGRVDPVGALREE